MITILWPLALSWVALSNTDVDDDGEDDGDKDDVDSGDDDDDDDDDVEAGSFFMGLTCQLLTTQPPPTSKTHSNLISHTIEMKVKVKAGKAANQDDRFLTIFNPQPPA